MTSGKVRLKGTRQGFAVTLDSTLPYDLIEKETGELFTNLRQLANGATVSLEDGEEGVPEDLVSRLGNYLKTVFGVTEVLERRFETKPEETSDSVEEEHGEIPSEGIDMGDVKLLAGRVRSGQKVYAEKHLVILGDVNPGGEVAAGGDILILGSLCGTAIAGQADNEQSVILALDFRPTQVQIAGVVAAGSATSGKKPEYAYIENGAIVVDNYVTANPFGKLPVLEER